jgi:hypothetical protein
MTVFTKSVWFYGHTVTSQNRALDITRSAVQYTALIQVGTYSLTDYAQAVARALNTVDPDNLYIATVDRSNRQITISGSAAFSLDITGPTASVSSYSLLGFTANQSAATSHTGAASGLEFRPQLRLQNFTSFENDQESSDSVTNEAASGRVESVSFGRNKFMTCNIRYQNDGKTKFTESDPNGIENLRNFLLYATTKADLEFMPNREAPETFTKCVLESTARSQNGTGFRLVESDGIPGFFDSGRLIFRERV